MLKSAPGEEALAAAWDAVTNNFQDLRQTARESYPVRQLEVAYEACLWGMMAHNALTLPLDARVTEHLRSTIRKRHELLPQLFDSLDM